eukprot:8664185-Alexandrium_andersonii.AAC.1
MRTRTCAHAHTHVHAHAYAHAHTHMHKEFLGVQLLPTAVAVAASYLEPALPWQSTLDVCINT